MVSKKSNKKATRKSKVIATQLRDYGMPVSGVYGKTRKANRKTAEDTKRVSQERTSRIKGIVKSLRDKGKTIRSRSGESHPEIVREVTGGVKPPHPKKIKQKAVHKTPKANRPLNTKAPTASKAKRTK